MRARIRRPKGLGGITGIPGAQRWLCLASGWTTASAWSIAAAAELRRSAATARARNQARNGEGVVWVLTEVLGDGSEKPGEVEVA